MFICVSGSSVLRIIVRLLRNRNSLRICSRLKLRRLLNVLRNLKLLMLFMRWRNNEMSGRCRLLRRLER